MTAAAATTVPTHRPSPDEPEARTAWRRQADLVLAGRHAEHPALYLIDLNALADQPYSAVPDTALAAVETLLHRLCRRTGAALRLPRGQFLLLQVVRDATQARDTAEHLTRTLTRPLPTTGPWAASGPITLRVNIGVAISAAAHPDLTALYWSADIALYRATITGTAEIEVKR
jgi:GGDEF domain-containing protein